MCRWKSWICLLVSLAALLIACSGCKTDKSDAVNPPSDTQTILRILHYQNEAQDIFIQIINDFMLENPDIRVEYDLTGGDQYLALLRARLSAREEWDIIGVHPGESEAIFYARGGYLEKLSDEPFIQDIGEEFLDTGKYESDYYGLPIDASCIVCLYNTEVFEEMNLEIPQTWTEFINLCERLKRKSITPLAFGAKDLWITQMIPYALSSTTVYRDNPDFDSDMYDGKASFTDEPWRNTLTMYNDLHPYFNQDFLFMSYEQQLSLFADEKAAMTIMGTFALQLLMDENPELSLGAFILPGSDDGINYLCKATGGMLAINAQSKNKDAAKRFLNYFMRDNIYTRYVSESYNLPVKDGIKVDIPILNRLSAMDVGSHNFPNQEWPTGMADVFMQGIRKMFAGESIQQVLESYDQEWAVYTSEE